MSFHGKRIKKGICPRCNGTGFSRAFNRESKFSSDTRIRAEKLFNEGVTLRGIAKELGLKHPQTIKFILFDK